MIGGIITSFLMELIIYPPVFAIWKWNFEVKPKLKQPGPTQLEPKENAPLDNNTSQVLKGDVLCTANLGFTHATPEEADRTVVCMKGFPLPK
jgi:hypothetical protein